MKIAIATNERGFLEDKVAFHFGQAKSFLIYDTETESFEIYPNPEATGGIELPPDFLHRQEVKAVITFGLGPKAFRKFKNHNIKMYKAVKGTILENLQKFKDHKLNGLKKEDIF